MQVDIKNKVEEIGIELEKLGRKPMEGRVFAYLLLSDPPHQTFDEIREFLNASKSAISYALNNLQNEKTVKYITFSGDRKRYFKVDTDGWKERLIQTAKSFNQINDSIKDVIEIRKNYSDKELTKKIEKVHRFQTKLAQIIDEAAEKSEQ